MTTSQPSTQTAEARQSAEATLRELVVRFSPTHQPLVDTARGWLIERLPTAYEVVYEYRDCVVISYSPSGHGYEGVLAIRASAEGVRLYINRGKGVPDPEKLLQGAGAQARWIHLEGPPTLARPEVAALVDEAIARNSIPFAPTGRGPIVIRSEAVKQRPRRRPA